MDEQEQKLLNQLDALRNYGARTVGDIRQEVSAGKLEISAGISHPVIRDTSTGKLVTGSGRLPTTTTVIESRSSWDKAFRKAGDVYFDEVFEKLIDLCKSGNFKAIEFFMNRMAGKPTDNKDIPDKAPLYSLQELSASNRMAYRENPAPYLSPSKQELAEAREQGIQATIELHNKYEGINRRNHFRHLESLGQEVPEKYRTPNLDVTEKKTMSQHYIDSVSGSTVVRGTQPERDALIEEELLEVEGVPDAMSQKEIDSIIEQGIEHARVEQKKRKQKVSEVNTAPAEDFYSDVAHQVMVDDALRSQGLW